MDLSTNQRIIIISVFFLYTIALLVYSLVTRKSLKEEKGDYLSKFYTGGRSGGIKGVASAMVIQGIVMTISVLVLFIMGVNSTGLSYTTTIQKLMVSNPDWFKPSENALQTMISFAILWGVTTFTLPHVTMTALTYKDTKTLHRAIKIGTVVVAIWLIGLNGLCFVTKYTFAEGILATPDLAIPSLAVRVMPAWAAGLVLAGVCGAVQSSMGGMVVSLAGMISGIALYLLIDKGILGISLGFNACIMATFLSTVIAVMVSLITPKPQYGIVRTWFGRIPEMG